MTNYEIIRTMLTPCFPANAVQEKNGRYLVPLENGEVAYVQFGMTALTPEEAVAAGEEYAAKQAAKATRASKSAVDYEADRAATIATPAAQSILNTMKCVTKPVDAVYLSGVTGTPVALVRPILTALFDAGMVTKHKGKPGELNTYELA